MTLPLLQNLDVQEKRVLVRVDFNVPLDKQGKITDDTRLKESLPTLRYLLDHGASVVLLSHLGRPKHCVDPTCSLNVCSTRLAELLHHPVLFARDPISTATQIQCQALKPGEVLLLENLRFYAAEETPTSDPEFAKKLASLGDLYVNDAFGTAHRSHSSTALIATYFPKKRAAGLLMQKEVTQLDTLLTSPKRPFFAILGGSKVSSKLGVLQSLLEKINVIFIGGGMAFTFLKTLGMSIGDSIHDPNLESEAKLFLDNCQQRGITVWLPEDFMIADHFSADAKTQIVTRQQGIPSGWQGMDIGPLTLTAWQQALSQASTIFWNGPVGVFEFPAFANGTNELARCLASSKAVTVIGGGDSVAAINQLGLADSFTHISTGGGASLEYLEFGKLPGIEALKE
ncbi:MAG: phosphoglycerate kinase [Anaplasmataceae bacterium]|nr:phosphoglycerate kinase [Anaplasmataceae bacterium]